jgi:hypothetical protein
MPLSFFSYAVKQLQPAKNTYFAIIVVGQRYS